MGSGWEIKVGVRGGCASTHDLQRSAYFRRTLPEYPNKMKRTNTHQCTGMEAGAVGKGRSEG